MKQMILIYSFFFLLSCGENKDTAKKNASLASIAVFAYAASGTVQNTTNSGKADCGSPPACFYLPLIEQFNSNLTFVKVYFQNQLVFTSQSGNSYAFEKCRENSLKFESNAYVKEIQGFRDKDGFCKLTIFLSNGEVKVYNQRYDGYLNTFTEITAGDYRFVPVR